LETIVDTQAMLDEIQSGTLAYSFDDYKTLLQLQLQIDQSGKDTSLGAGGVTDSMIGAPMSASNDKNRRAYGEYMIVCQLLTHRSISKARH